jgi:hypothetical protein
LLLREAGVPARYCIGFAVLEHDPRRRESTIRGTHAHAWCRAWDEGRARWIDIDLTPPDWSGREGGRMPGHQWLFDAWQRLREDIFVWRSQPGNVNRVTAGIAVVATLVAAYVAYRLWRSRRRGALATAASSRPLRRQHPLASLERLARKRFGTRPPGVPLTPWLAQLAACLPDTRELDEALALHDRIRFDPAWAEPNDRERLATMVAQVRTLLR